MINMNNLKCPKCRAKFHDVKIEAGAVKCPECSEVVFEYLLPEEQPEQYTPLEFMKLLDTRGVEAANRARRFFPAGVRGAGASLYLVGYIWTELAKTVFVKTDGTLQA
jgi:uncharacterized protein (UPF0212 family)